MTAVAIGLPACAGDTPAEPGPAVEPARAAEPEPATLRALGVPAAARYPVPAPSPRPDAARPEASEAGLLGSAPSTTRPGTTPAETVQPEPPTYSATISEITPELAARMTSSWRPGCPVPLGDLRHVTVTHHDFSGAVVTGEIVVHADVADGVVEVFRALFAAGYPIRQMRLVDEFDGDDGASMSADNTSAFNCRPVAGTSRWSEHAYGRAIDLNPVENPWVRGGSVDPPEGRAFVDRPQAPGVIRADDAVVQAFAAQGWSWGGSWRAPIDYQHFSVSGR